jgi:PAS domain S-box-containing protein
VHSCNSFRIRSYKKGGEGGLRRYRPHIPDKNRPGASLTPRDRLAALATFFEAPRRQMSGYPCQLIGPRALRNLLRGETCKTKNVAHEIFISEPTVNFCKASPSASVAVRYQRCYTHGSMGEAAQTRTPDIELFRGVFHASPIGIAVENLEGQPLFANPAFCSFLGFSEEELRNKHCVDFSPPEDAGKDWALFQQLRAGSIDHYQLEKRYFRRDGSLVWGSLSISLLKSGPSPLVLAMVEDITDKKNAEEARFRHAAVIESSDDAIASGTLDGIIVSWNTGAQKIYGYTEAEAVGKPITMLVPPELPDEENKILETVKSGHRIEHYETVRVTKTGKRINVSLTISPIKDSTGRTVGVSGIARDITERKLAEEALRASEERLRLAQHAARIGTFDWNIRTGVNAWTPELEAMYGLPPGGFGGTQTAFENLVHPDDRAAVIQLVDASMKSGQPTKGEWRVFWGDGSVHWIAGRWQVFMDASGEPSKVIGVNGDITERKLADEARLEVNRILEAQAALLQSQEELLKIFVKHVPAAVAMLDRDMRYLQVSDRWCADFSLDSSQILGRSHYEIFPDLPEPWKQIHCRALAGESLRAEEDRWDREDGTTTWSRWEIRPWQNPDGLQGGILIFSEDITYRKHAEEALLAMSRKLIEAQERERTRIGRELHDDIGQRLAMTAIELQQLHDDPLILPEVRSRMGKLQSQTSEIASDIQSLSHELHSAKLQYLGIAPAMRGFCREFGEQQKVEIDFQTHDLPSPVPPDTALCFFRVLQEALHNSAKHSGVRHFKVRLWGTSDEIHLTVADSGAGFDCEAAMKSTGLGLTSMQERLRSVGGALSIESQPRRGTTIHARVPFTSSRDSALAAR